jgi:hypothetical protein
MRFKIKCQDKPSEPQEPVEIKLTTDGDGGRVYVQVGGRTILMIDHRGVYRWCMGTISQQRVAAMGFSLDGDRIAMTQPDPIHNPIRYTTGGTGGNR